MTFAGINYLAVLIAAVAGWVAGALWYMALAKPWMAAVGTTQETDRSVEVAARRVAAVHLRFRRLRGHGLGAGRA